MADFGNRIAVRQGSDADAAGTYAYVLHAFKDLGDGTHAPGVAIMGLDGDVTLTGNLMADTLGALDNAKVVNPDAASATIPALLRGILKQQVDILTAVQALQAAVGAAADAAGDDTVIGQLKQIADNTAP